MRQAENKQENNMTNKYTADQSLREEDVIVWFESNEKWLEQESMEESYIYDDYEDDDSDLRNQTPVSDWDMDY